MKRITSMLVAAAALVACGSNDDVSITNAWARASAPTQGQGAVYFDLTVAADDTLVGASVPATVAAGAEIHEVVMIDSAAMDDTSTDAMDDMSTDTMDDMSTDTTEMSEGSDDMSDMGTMQMRELTAGLPLVADETVSFEPGSYHVMLPGLVEPLQVGDEFDLTLQFANADDVTVTVEVADSAP
jgi:copper(I)-binding protein